MRSVLCLALALLMWGIPAPTSPAWGQGGCLSPREQQQQIRSGQVVRPGQLGRQLGGDVLRMRLCRGNGNLVWNVTVLGRDGRVVHRTLDARTGRQLR